MVYKNLIVVSNLRDDSRFVAKSLNRDLIFNEARMYKLASIMRTSSAYLIAA